ncbi:hypothetical protein THIOKS1860006 [Thiocapsa sp. KS1]|nr:hypothetical protein THIOKS1860006 [Thiocapsa sp. KS1]
MARRVSLSGGDAGRVRKQLGLVRWPDEYGGISAADRPSRMVRGIFANPADFENPESEPVSHLPEQMVWEL